MRQFVRDDRSFTFLRGSEKCDCRIDADHILHPSPDSQPPDAEARLEIIRGAIELPNANIFVQWLRKRAGRDLSDQPLLLFPTICLGGRERNGGEKHGTDNDGGHP
jgi:hypothetical protein